MSAAGAAEPTTPTTAAILACALQKRAAAEGQQFSDSQAYNANLKPAAPDSDSSSSSTLTAGPFQRLKLICEHTAPRVHALFTDGPLPLAAILEGLQKRLMKPQFLDWELAYAPPLCLCATSPHDGRTPPLRRTLRQATRFRMLANKSGITVQPRVGQHTFPEARHSFVAWSVGTWKSCWRQPSM